MKTLRDFLAFVAGLVILYHQTAVAEEAQMVLVVAALALAGIGLPLRLDEMIRSKNNKNGVSGS